MIPMAQFKSWWYAIDQDPGNVLLLGMFADELSEIGHAIAPAMRWAFEKRRVPFLYTYIRADYQWYWFNGTRSTITHWLRRGVIQPGPVTEASLLPKWLMRSQGSYAWMATYKTCSGAYRGLCDRFVKREKRLACNTGNRMFTD